MYEGFLFVNVYISTSILYCSFIKSDQKHRVRSSTNPFHLQKFKKYQLELQAQLLETGIQLDFTKGKGFVEERTRCFWSDLIKENII